MAAAAIAVIAHDLDDVSDSRPAAGGGAAPAAGLNPTARAACTRPAPCSSSRPGGPRSRALESSVARTSTGVVAAPEATSSAATPETWAAAAEVEAVKQKQN